MKKELAGYQMLHILAAVDGNFSPKEDLIIRNYIVENFPSKVDLDPAMEVLSTLAKEDYILHFEKCMNDFYSDSTIDERNHLMDFAMQLVNADKFISKYENIFIHTLFDAWDAQEE